MNLAEVVPIEVITALEKDYEKVTGSDEKFTRGLTQIISNEVREELGKSYLGQL